MCFLGHDSRSITGEAMKALKSFSAAVLLSALVFASAHADKEPGEHCEGGYPGYLRLIAGGELQWTGDRLSLTKKDRAEVFNAKGRYSGQILYPVAALFDEYPEARYVQFSACGARNEVLSVNQVRAEPGRYYLWNRKVQNGYLKLMDFGSLLKDSTREPIPEAERGGGPRWRRNVGGVSGNPEKLRFIHTISLSAKRLPNTADAAGAAASEQPSKSKAKGRPRE